MNGTNQHNELTRLRKIEAMARKIAADPAKQTDYPRSSAAVACDILTAGTTEGLTMTIEQQRHEDQKAAEFTKRGICPTCHQHKASSCVCVVCEGCGKHEVPGMMVFEKRWTSESRLVCRPCRKRYEEAQA